jgi:ferric-dicitrate binding protein FerR (iron transport regulator)
VRAAVEAHWTEKTKRHRRRGSLRRAAWIAATLTLLLTASFLLKERIGVPMLDEISRVTIERIDGTVRLGDDGGATVELTLGHSLPMGATLSTEGDGGLALRMPSGHSVRLDRDSQLRLIDPAHMALDRGAIYVDSDGSDSRRLSLVVQTRFGEVREIGTQFEVRLLERSIRLRLREGAVVMARDSEFDEVMAGTEYELFEDGRTSMGPIAPYSPEWSWVQRIAPMLDFEGRTARELLDWIARESGLHLAFDDEATAHAADETILRGATESLSPARALEEILPSCGMRHRIERGVLIVSSE